MEFFISEVVLPQMNPFPGRNSVLVMDNAPIHHGGWIAEICKAADILLIYLPLYSPDLNPIEKVFLVLKSQLERHQILTGSSKDSQAIKDFLPSFATALLMRHIFLGSGYLAR